MILIDNSEGESSFSETSIDFAADAMYDEFSFSENFVPTSSGDDKSVDVKKTGVLDLNANNQKDYVSRLTSLCIKRKWPPPQFELKGTSGRPHCPNFHMLCSILKSDGTSVEGSGNGGSKRQAKRRAAGVVYQKLKVKKKLGMYKSSNVTNYKLYIFDNTTTYCITFLFHT